MKVKKVVSNKQLNRVDEITSEEIVQIIRVIQKGIKALIKENTSQKGDTCDILLIKSDKEHENSELKFKRWRRLCHPCKIESKYRRWWS